MSASEHATDWAQRGDYQLWDIDSQNAVGFYETLGAALRDVAETIDLYGAESPEVLALVLIRLDVPPAEGRVAAGAALVRKALERPAAAHPVV
ncbi:MAG TPA: hypothetical protein VNK05_09300 [Chloroflexota bacterium]|nr:hypothetical protein [Chloroflexota bacterium]